MSPSSTPTPETSSAQLGEVDASVEPLPNTQTEEQAGPPTVVTFGHGDVVDGSAWPGSAGWPGKPEYLQIDWSKLRGYQTLDNRVVLVDTALPAPEALRADMQSRLDAMGIDAGLPEVPDSNGITPSQDLSLRVGHVGKQLVTVRLFKKSDGTHVWRASTTNGEMLSGNDREAVVRRVNDWLAANSTPDAWVVVAANGPSSAASA